MPQRLSGISRCPSRSAPSARRRTIGNNSSLALDWHTILPSTRSWSSAAASPSTSTRRFITCSSIVLPQPRSSTLELSAAADRAKSACPLPARRVRRSVLSLWAICPPAPGLILAAGTRPQWLQTSTTPIPFRGYSASPIKSAITPWAKSPMWATTRLATSSRSTPTRTLPLCRALTRVRSPTPCAPIRRRLDMDTSIARTPTSASAPIRLTVNTKPWNPSSPARTFTASPEPSPSPGARPSTIPLRSSAPRGAATRLPLPRIHWI